MKFIAIGQEGDAGKQSKEKEYSKKRAFEKTYLRTLHIRNPLSKSLSKRLFLCGILHIES